MLPWQGNTEETFRSSSQAATSPPVYHTRWGLHSSHCLFKQIMLEIGFICRSHTTAPTNDAISRSKSSNGIIAIMTQKQPNSVIKQSSQSFTGCAVDPDNPRLAPQGHSGAVPPQITACAPPNHCLCPPSEDCAPKKLRGSVKLKCNSRPETPKILVITREFVSKNCFLVNFAISTVCLCGFIPEFMKIRVYLGTKIFFFSVFTLEFVKICVKHLFRLVHTLKFK